MVWDDGKYTPGVAGITRASMAERDAGVIIELGSGRYVVPTAGAVSPWCKGLSSFSRWVLTDSRVGVVCARRCGVWSRYAFQSYVTE